MPSFPSLPFASRNVDAAFDEDLVDNLYDRDEGLRERNIILPLAEVNHNGNTFVIQHNWFVRFPIWANVMHVVFNGRVNAYGGAGDEGHFRCRLDNTLFSDTPDPTIDQTAYDSTAPIIVTFSDVSAYAGQVKEVELQLKVLNLPRTVYAKQIHGCPSYFTV